MRIHIYIAFASFAYAGPCLAQISTAGMDESMTQVVGHVNKCLAEFDSRARTKKLSVENYKAALEGACTQEISETRGLYSLHMEHDPDRDYHLHEFDNSVRDGRAKLVSAYAMR